MNNTSFYIYDASAGSGKTFSLVKEYLKVLFNSKEKEPYRHILAITFTNKAVGEMKSRIIKNLTQFANNNILDTPNDMFKEICFELNLSPETLNIRSRILLKKILHNYSAFEISTIDKFTQRLIRNFAYDLNLPVNFEVELDTDLLLEEAVDNLIAKAGSGKALSKVLIDFALEKADDDRSWNIAYDFNEIAKLLTSENHLNGVQKVSDKSLEDFKSLKEVLLKRKTSVETKIVSVSDSVLELISSRELEFSNFNGSYLPKHFQKLSHKNFSASFTSKWQEDLETSRLYPKTKTAEEVAQRIEAIQPELAKSFSITKQLVYQLKFITNFYKNITPLSVLNAINKELQDIKKERDVILISEFNSIVSSHLKHQPAPFIYERIGEKFKHYFIDEFQDTSVMQWENLVPLIENALSSENSSVMLVGDAKQAIYRWRGGRAEQFINLSSGKNPFHIKNDKKDLKDNYRSSKQIIQFNNDFFKYLSILVFRNTTHRSLYSGASQNIINQDIGGFVDISFLNSQTDDLNEAYGLKVMESISSCLDNGFSFRDMCVLVRKKKEGVALAEFLTQNNIPIVSSETLLVANSPKIQFILNLLKLLLEPQNNELKLKVLLFLDEHCLRVKDSHQFYADRVHLSIKEFFRSLETYDFFLNYSEVVTLPLYEAIESIIRDFEIQDTTDAHLQFFKDFILQYSQKKLANIYDFLEHFSKHKDKLNIVSSNLMDAVNIMTIHKAKGLEFPIVIFPYANLDIYRQENPKAWLTIDPEDYSNFNTAFISLNKDVVNYNEKGEQLYETNQEELELDNINLLYVALTRAAEQLYIISDFEEQKDGNAKIFLNRYSGLLISYLKHKRVWDNARRHYTFGLRERESSRKSISRVTSNFNEYSNKSNKDKGLVISTRAGYLWDTKQKSAIEKGNLVHLLMSKIYTEKDIDFAISDLVQTGQLLPTQIVEINSVVKSIMSHLKLKECFEEPNKIYNERDIITSDGEIIRPDRLVVSENGSGVLLDYKTGLFNIKHEQQLGHYAAEINKMGIPIHKSFLVYINDEVEVKEI